MVKGRPQPTPAPDPDREPVPALRRFLRRFLRRLTASGQQREAEQLQHEVARSGCAAAAGVRRGEQVRLTGRLRTVVYTPRMNVPTLEAELYDGTGTVTLVWLGRRRISGIEPGQALTVLGRVAIRDDRCVIYNPRYELHP